MPGLISSAAGCAIFIMHGAERVEPLDQWRLAYASEGHSATYNIQWKDAERQGDIFLRRDDSLVQKWLEQAMSAPLPGATVPLTIQIRRNIK